MRFLILNRDYPDFLSWFYAQHPGLQKGLYEQQLKARLESLFGWVDFYSSNLGRLGHEAWSVHVNNEFMQKAWAREHGLQVGEGSSVRERMWALRKLAGRTPVRHLRPLCRPLLGSGDGAPPWFYDILASQIKTYKPDILLNQCMYGISNRFLHEMKSYIPFLIGQHAATPLSDSDGWNCYDLVISSFPPTVEHFRQKGLKAELHRLGFDPKVLSCLVAEERTTDITFIGSFHKVHRTRTRFLETVCVRFPQLKIWGQPIDSLSPASPLRKCYVGQAWGRQMYQIFRKSKITLNHHGDIGPYANNFRLYEATGVGSLLITDWKENLHEMFELGKEVIAYRTPEECMELLSYYLDHDEERESIAGAGQQRTLRDHNYDRRMRELLEIVRRYA